MAGGQARVQGDPGPGGGGGLGGGGGWMGTLCTVSREQQRSVSSVAAAAAGTIFGTEVRSGAVSELYSALCRTGAPPHQLCWEPIYELCRAN